MFQTKDLDKTKTHFIFINFFFVEICAVLEIMWRNIAEPGRPDANMAHAHCMMDTQVYKHTNKM
jgi:hypothetical protein